jgi:hypothetical protein
VLGLPPTRGCNSLRSGVFDSNAAMAALLVQPHAAALLGGMHNLGGILEAATRRPVGHQSGVRGSPIEWTTSRAKSELNDLIVRGSRKTNKRPREEISGVRGSRNRPGAT